MTQTDPLLGQVIADRYQILERLGAGGMGRVYLAEHVRMGRKCAIKVMSPELAVAADAISRFHREAANASRINHPNVAQIFDFGETAEGTLYLAMEFIEGETLTRIIEREGALPLMRAVAITKQIADALGAAHHLGIVHRDLKPENIMVARHLDGSDWVKVVDFGIAKTTQASEGGSQTVTTMGVSLGTPEYMSPEQLAGEKLDQRSDIYALGLVCFHMLTGDLPYPRVTSRESLVTRLTSRARTLAEVRPDKFWPAQVQRALDRALAPETAERYGKVTDLSRDLMRATELAGDLDRTVPLEPLRVQQPRGATPVASAGRARTRQLPPEPPRRRSILFPILFAVALLAAGALAAQRYPAAAERLSAKVAGWVSPKVVAAIAKAADMPASQPGALDSAARQARLPDTAAIDRHVVDSVPSLASAAAPRDSVAQQGAPTPKPPTKDTAAADTAAAAAAAHASSVADPAHRPAVATPVQRTPTPATTQRTPVIGATTAPAPAASAPAPAVAGLPRAEHTWLRANGDSGAAQPLGAQAADSDRLRAVGEEIEGHIQRANRVAASGDFARARNDYMAAARELAVVREIVPGAPTVVQAERSLTQGIRGAYAACRQAAGDSTAVAPAGFRCEMLIPRRPGQHRNQARFGGRGAANVP